MAKVEIKLPDEFLKKITALGERTDEIIPRVLEAGGEVMASKIRSNLLAVVGSRTKYKSRSTGELADALGISPALLDRNGNYNVKVGFSEPRKNGESNARIANILEYGRPGQPPKPFLKPAKSASRKACTDTMTEALERELDEL